MDKSLPDRSHGLKLKLHAKGNVPLRLNLSCYKVCAIIIIIIVNGVNVAVQNYVVSGHVVKQLYKPQQKQQVIVGGEESALTTS